MDFLNKIPWTYVGAIGLILTGIAKMASGDTEAGLATISLGVSIIGGRRIAGRIESSTQR